MTKSNRIEDAPKITENHALNNVGK